MENIDVLTDLAVQAQVKELLKPTDSITDLAAFSSQVAFGPVKYPKYPKENE
jgi:hypothetical protein